MHYCGKSYIGSKNHIFYSHATFMDVFCPDKLAETHYLKDETRTKFFLARVDKYHEKSANWKKVHIHLTQKQIKDYPDSIKRSEAKYRHRKSEGYDQAILDANKAYIDAKKEFAEYWTKVDKDHKKEKGGKTGKLMIL